MTPETPGRARVTRMPSPPRITADFNYGGRAGEIGVVYLGRDTLRQLEEAGVELRDGLNVTLSDFDGTSNEPTWLVADGVVSRADAGQPCEFRYAWSECRWEPRD